MMFGSLPTSVTYTTPLCRTRCCTSRAATSRNLPSRVYAANGIRSHILPPDSPRFLATPELSFTIRTLRADGGLNISASHNPPDDNGGKFYDERGGQPVPPDDQIMSDYVEQVAEIRSIPWADAVRSGKVQFLDDAPHKAYIDLCRRQSVADPPRGDEFRVVFTPLHGVGSMTAMEALRATGFKPIPVPEQMSPDGQFPNVTKTPNPEVRECLDRAEHVARDHHAQLAIATDPDADRIGGLVCQDQDGNGDYRFLTGNEICALLTHFKLSQLANSRPASRLAHCRHDRGDDLDGRPHRPRTSMRRSSTTCLSASNILPKCCINSRRMAVTKM